MEYIDGFIEANRRKKLEPVLEMLVHDPGLVTGDMVEDVLKFKRLDGVDAALKKLRDTLFPAAGRATSCATGSARSKVPVRVVWGREDRIVPAAHGRGPAGLGPGHRARPRRPPRAHGEVEGG